MAKGSGKALRFVAYLTGIIVALSVGFAMTGDGPLNTIPYIPSVITAIAGWIVVIATLLSIILKIVEK